MRRRQVLSGAIAAFATYGTLALPRIERSASVMIRETPFAERSFRNRSGDAASPGITSLRCRVESHRTGDQAADAFEQHYADETTHDDEEQFAEISFSDAVEHHLPLDMIELPHRFATYTTVAGAAAFEADHAVGVVRRETIVWLYVVQGHGAAEIADTIGEIAAAMVEREVGGAKITVDGQGQHHGSFWDLLPTLDDVPDELILDAETSPDGQFNALGTPIPATPAS